MKKGLSVFLLCALIMGTLVFVAPSINSGEAFAQTTVRTRYRRHKRTFWQKHRDKLTLAGTTAGGAGIGAVAGGKKGAAIGSLVGLGSGAVYTYKIRKRHRHYRRYQLAIVCRGAPPWPPLFVSSPGRPRRDTPTITLEETRMPRP